MTFRLPCLAAAAAATFVITALPVLADVRAPWSLDQLSAFSTLVVRARVVDLAAQWDPSVQGIYTYATVDVTETWKGSPTSSRLVIKLLGGRLDNLELRITGTPDLARGDDVALWLEVRPRDGTLYPAAVNQGVRHLGGLDDATIDDMRARAAASPPRSAAFVTAPPELRAQAAYSFLPPSEGGPGRWHETDTNTRVAVDYQSFPSGAAADVTNLDAAITLWNTSGMNLQLERRNQRGARCAATFEGDGRISVSFNDPCGEVAQSGSVLGLGGAYMTPVIRNVNGTPFTKIIQGVVVLPQNSSPVLAQRGCFQDALTHNLGHAIGLGHSAEPAAIMSPTPQAACGANPSELADDDRAGARAIYPTGLPDAMPGTPTNLTANTTGSTVTLTWTAPSLGGAVTTYVVEAGSSPGLSNLANATTNSTQPGVTFTNVPSGLYYVRIRARNAVSTGNASNEVAVGVNFTPPGTPTALSATVTGQTVVLNWAAPASGGAISNYVIEAGSSPGLSNLAVASTTGSQTSIGFSGVPFGTYYVRVRARNALGVGAASNEIVVTLTCPIPPPPTNLVATRSGSNVAFTWQAPAGGGAAGYLLVVGSTPGAANLLVADVGNVTAVSASGPRGTYYVRTLSRNACGTSATSSNEVVVQIP